MSVEDISKKLIGEPLMWVAMSMVGVVLMGPTAAKMARQIVGGDANRGDVDQHGETIVRAEPDVFSQIGKTTAADSIAQRLAMRDNANKGSATSKIDTELGQVNDDTTGEDDSLTADDIRAELEELRRRSEELGADHKKAANVQSKLDNSTSKEVDAKVPSEQNRSGTKRGDVPLSSSPSGSATPDAVASKTLETPKAESQISSDELDVGQLPTTNDTKPLPKQEMSKNLDSETTGEKQNGKLPAPDLSDLEESETVTPPSDEPEGEGEIFSTWDEPLQFKSDSESAKDFGSDLSMKRLPQPEANLARVPDESGDVWWDAMVAQQFWPDRQAQLANLDAVVFVALQNSANIQILNDQPRIEETFVQQREADFDWSAFVDASWNSVDEPIRSELQTGVRSGRYVQEELFVGSGLQKRLVRGGQLRVGSTIGTLDNNSIFLAPPDQGTATFSLDYRQPLMRGRGREVNQSQIVLARLNVEASEQFARQEMQQYLTDVVTAYWTLYRARGVLAQRHRNAMRASEVLRRIADRAQPDSISGQLVRAKAVAAARHSEVIDAEYVVANAQEQLMNLTHGDSLANANNVEIIPTDAPPQFFTPHDLNSVTELAISNRSEVKQVLAEIKAATVQQVIALDGLKPQLDAIISSYVAGVRGDKDVGNAIYDQFSAGDPSYSVGLSFEIPIGRRSASAGMKRQEIQSRLLQNKLRQTLSDVSMSARSAFRDVYRLTAIVENNRQVVAQSAQDVNSIERQSGWLQNEERSAALYLNDLLLAQDRLAAAEQNLLDSQAQLAIAYVTLKRATGELLQDQSVEYSEGDGMICHQASIGDPEVVKTTYEEPVKFQTEDQPVGWFSKWLQRRRSMPASTVIEEAPALRLDQSQPPAGISPVPQDADTTQDRDAQRRYPRSALRQGVRAERN